MGTAVGERARTRWLLPVRFRKALLSAHVIASVGWIGADLCLLLLGIRALTSEDARLGQGACVQMAEIAAWVTGPLSLLALLSGIAVSVTTRWGLFRHLWVVVSLVLTLLMAAAVTLALGPLLNGLADRVLAAPPTARVPDVLGAEGVQLIIPPCVAFVLLSLVTVINVYKPWGKLGAARAA